MSLGGSQRAHFCCGGCYLKLPKHSDTGAPQQREPDNLRGFANLGLCRSLGNERWPTEDFVLPTTSPLYAFLCTSTRPCYQGILQLFQFLFCPHGRSVLCSSFSVVFSKLPAAAVSLLCLTGIPEAVLPVVSPRLFFFLVSYFWGVL